METNKPNNIYLITVVLALIAGFAGGALSQKYRFFEPGSGALPPLRESAVGGEQADESDIVAAVELAGPSVAAIAVVKEVPKFEEFTGDPFGFFGRGIFRRPTGESEDVEVGGGSAFVVADGLLVTNKHVVDDTDAKFYALFKDGSRAEAEVVARDPAMDLAILKVGKQGLKPLKIGDSGALKPGQMVIAIGNPLGDLPNSVSVGVVSGLGRKIEAGGFGRGATETLDQVIQTDAAINFGNSGGPLLNIRGEVIGVNTAVNDGAQNIGFAIPSAEVSNILDSYQKQGKITRAKMGVRYVQITPRIASEYELGEVEGVLLVRGDNGEPAVEPDSGADKAGLKEGDAITEFDGKKITSETPLTLLIRTKKPGDKVTVRYMRGGAVASAVVTLTEAK